MWVKNGSSYKKKNHGMPHVRNRLEDRHYPQPGDVSETILDHQASAEPSQTWRIS